jgi:lysophospholipase L1-like esterase
MRLGPCVPLILFALVVSATVLGDEAKPAPGAGQGKPRLPGKFELLDGDRVAFIGDTLIERMQSYDYIETALTVRYPDRNITFRNLGWSGDTVFGDSRSSFGTTADGFKHLRDRVSDFKPTVVFLGYGGGHSFDGAAGLPRFLTGMETLIAMLSETKPAIVVLSPIRHEDLGRPLSDPAPHNKNRALYRDALRQFAAARGFPFVDLFDLLGGGTKANPPHPLTDNGIHLSAYGYWRAAAALEQTFGWTSTEWRIEFDSDGKPAKAYGTRLSDVEAAAGRVQFTTLDDRLPMPRPAVRPPEGTTGNMRAIRVHDRMGLIFETRMDGAMYPSRVIRVSGLPLGRYVVKVDGLPVAEFHASDLPTEVKLVAGPEFEQVEKLRRTSLAKNELFFHRWRPQNETYLLGFRKHEQGQNAREIPWFDPLIVEKEAAIAELRVPVAHRYEIARVP